MKFTIRDHFLVTVIVALAAGLCGTTSTSLARPTRYWTQQALFDEADLVIVATASERKKMENSDHFLTEYLQQYETELDVKSVLKGKECESKFKEQGDKKKVEAKLIKFVHFRYRADVKSTLGNGPSFAILRTATVVKGEPIPAPEYLLYPRKRKDGRYEPVTGNTDPKESVYRLIPHPHIDAGFDDADIGGK